ncbi:hypothetical protein BN1723_019095 [Verticillium longisporum]|uniref:Uncharacterized protein n=1 Tax=Verticillium longisporum TaxID=100787 RepID=A0A0G4N9I3_VERLO|nr:hypothetical protein BN1723_019095 [Verticillium longisporum]
MNTGAGVLHNVLKRFFTAGKAPRAPLECAQV